MTSRMRLKLGEVVASKYRIERVLGKGGMGVVYAATHLALDEPVAIKVLQSEAAHEPHVVKRFKREARAAAKIKSEYGTRVLDVAALPNGLPYIVMEFLEGEDLAERLKRVGTLDVETAARFVLQASEAIAEAHAMGIVHCDLKPDNLFVIKSVDGVEQVKVLDFGISRAVEPTASMLGLLSNIVGTPVYMSPEQLRANPDVDQRSDIWTLGVLLYELVTRTPPFAALSFPELATSILEEEPESLVDQDSQITHGFELVVMRCLRKKPEDRYPSLAQFTADLAEFAPQQGKVTAARVARVLSGPRTRPTLPHRTDASGDSPRKRARSTSHTDVMVDAGALREAADKDSAPPGNSDNADRLAEPSSSDVDEADTGPTIPNGRSNVAHDLAELQSAPHDVEDADSEFDTIPQQMTPGFLALLRGDEDDDSIRQTTQMNRSVVDAARRLTMEKRATTNVSAAPETHDERRARAAIQTADSDKPGNVKGGSSRRQSGLQTALGAVVLLALGGAAAALLVPRHDNPRPATEEASTSGRPATTQPLKPSQPRPATPATSFGQRPSPSANVLSSATAAGSADPAAGAKPRASTAASLAASASPSISALPAGPHPTALHSGIGDAAAPASAAPHSPRPQPPSPARYPIPKAPSLPPGPG